MKTTIINLWGGPGSGKSTLALAATAALKRRGASAELVTEFVKDWCWRGQAVGPFDAPYITASQLYRESGLYGKVDFLVTDSPVSLGAVFERLFRPGDHMMHDLCRSIRARQAAAGLVHVDLLVPRRHAYVPEGRWQTEEDAVRLDEFCRDHLHSLYGPGNIRLARVETDVLAALGIYT